MEEADAIAALRADGRFTEEQKAFLEEAWFENIMLNHPELYPYPMQVLRDAAVEMCDSLNSGLTIDELIIVWSAVASELSDEALALLIWAAIEWRCPEYSL